MTELDKKKGFLEVAKFIGSVLTVLIVGISSALFTAIKENNFSFWVFIGLFVDSVLIISMVILIIKMIGLSEDMEDLK